MLCFYHVCTFKESTCNARHGVGTWSPKRHCWTLAFFIVSIMKLLWKIYSSPFTYHQFLEWCTATWKVRQSTVSGLRDGPTAEQKNRQKKAPFAQCSVFIGPLFFVLKNSVVLSRTCKCMKHNWKVYLVIDLLVSWLLDEWDRNADRCILQWKYYFKYAIAQCSGNCGLW